MKNKQEIKKIVVECGLDESNAKDLEKILELTVEKETDFDKDELILKYAQNKTQVIRKQNVWKWALSVSALIALALILTFTYKYRNIEETVQTQNIVYAQNEGLDIDLQLAILDAEIEMLQTQVDEYEIYEIKLEDYDGMDSTDDFDDKWSVS